MPGHALVSIIIPAYNTAPYIDRCIRSLLKQTDQRFEVILIDDGSTDDTHQVYAKYITEDEKYRYFRQPNSGTGIARNYGIQQARCEWVTFLDSDDYLEPDYIEVLLHEASLHDVGIVACNYVSEKNDGTLIAIGSNPPHNLLCDSVMFYRELVSPNTLYCGVITMKLIRRDLMAGYHFTNIRYGEDTEYLILLMDQKNRMAYIPYQGYHYVRVAESATMKTTVPEYIIKLDHTQVWSHLRDKKDVMGDFYYDAIMKTYYNTLYSAMTSLKHENARDLYTARIPFLTDHCSFCVTIPGIDTSILSELHAFLQDPLDWFEKP